jgi:hypothetical protein
MATTLWRHDAKRTAPVVSQVFYTPSILQSVFSPFIEAIRYGRELQPRQPGSWCVRKVGPRWFLLAVSMFRFDAVKNLLLDFSQDLLNGLDTCGANWGVPFSKLYRGRLAFAPTHFEPYQPGADLIKAPIQWSGVRLQEVGSTRREGPAHCRGQTAGDQRAASAASCGSFVWILDRRALIKLRSKYIIVGSFYGRNLCHGCLVEILI